MVLTLVVIPWKGRMGGSLSSPWKYESSKGTTNRNTEVEYEVRNDSNNSIIGCVFIHHVTSDWAGEQADWLGHSFAGQQVLPPHGQWQHSWWGDQHEMCRLQTGVFTTSQQVNVEKASIELTGEDIVEDNNPPSYWSHSSHIHVWDTVTPQLMPS